jgi:hypothetical protein
VCEKHSGGIFATCSQASVGRLRHQTGGRLTRDQFRYDPAENVYYCPEGKALRYGGRQFANQAYTYCSTEAQYQPAWQAVQALVGTPAYERSRRARYKIEALLAELKQRMRLERVRLHRLWNVGEQFLLAATAQNLKRLVRFLAQRPPKLETQVE